MKYTDLDKVRISNFSQTPSLNNVRSEWRRDYGRLIHCPSFRRLQGKTQLFPAAESDFFRNRLTHSLEVAQIAKAIGLKLNESLDSKEYFIDLDLLEFASLAHDLGHPPFGHLGEDVLDSLMKDNGGYEGNAQTLRILSKLEKKESRGKEQVKCGLGLTVRSLASILKYDRVIPLRVSGRKKMLKRGDIRSLDYPVKGFYYDDLGLVNKIKDNITGRKKYNGPFKTIECQIMDIADDIAYSTYDLEDSFKAGFIKPTDILFADNKIIKSVLLRVFNSTGKKMSIKDFKDIVISIFGDLVAPVGIDSNVDTKEAYKIAYLIGQIINDASNRLLESYNRTAFMSGLVNRFINAVEIDKINKVIPALSTVKLKSDEALEIGVLKYFVFESQILSPKLKIVAFRGKEIITTIFNALTEKGGYELLPPDFREDFESSLDKDSRNRVICDFIAGMTDRYAFEFYGRLKSGEPQTIFKPF